MVDVFSMWNNEALLVICVLQDLRHYDLRNRNNSHNVLHIARFGLTLFK